MRGFFNDLIRAQTPEFLSIYIVRVEFVLLRLVVTVYDCAIIEFLKSFIMSIHNLIEISGTVLMGYVAQQM